ncbi:hypothetical protein A2619_02560 [candidate division WWE3 bacterium RIFOXYD1_FULL_39_9]|uniref:Uncharacterized protein n=1 Tax=candidate division WWE3 bacterium RIFOXYD1_FULL_39_9 TaxID=1802649 RepID=A0A1F4X717_UNCKA|nr:MAG: hypothetical protein A2619_02560 [candidate division WWE3 bacterium RIFOXYD1_FULL_39_9]
MQKSPLSFYKIPLLISLTLGIVVTALGVIRDPMQIAFVFVGTILGTFVLDLEYVLNAIFVEPARDFSKTLLAYLKHSDIANAIRLIQYHKDDFHEKSLNSALFQIVLAFLSVLVIYSSRSFFPKALVLSVYANSIYVLLEYYYQNKLSEWFWTFKTKPGKQGFLAYLGLVVLVFGFCLYIL